ncbi:hypothetical protein RE6C_02143 [Rhodopirellula europaea 6C]|uniref:Uncharacterized protein n=1 Tax=Rhodopirellula europaea 6C TaxID=1263867 RepID=M2AWP2_9BACT|nr:hypothetical protein RE6C_02143 [Rhodopirellula europaea 6C]
MTKSSTFDQRSRRCCDDSGVELVRLVRAVSSVADQVTAAVVLETTAIK